MLTDSSSMLLYSRNQHDIVKQLHSNKNITFLLDLVMGHMTLHECSDMDYVNRK